MPAAFALLNSMQFLQVPVNDYLPTDAEFRYSICIILHIIKQNICGSRYDYSCC